MNNFSQKTSKVFKNFLNDLKNIKKQNQLMLKMSIILSSVFLSSQVFSGDKLEVDNLNYDINTYYNRQSPQDENVVSKFFSKLPFEYSIKAKYGKGKDMLAIFVDANCPYCLEYNKVLKENQDLINSTVYFFLIDLFDDPYKINDYIWCSKDREKNLHSWYKFRRDFPNLEKKQQFETWKEQKKIISTNCKTPVKFNKAFISSFFPIDGKIATPTTIFSNGLTSWSVENKNSLMEGFKYVEKHPFQVVGYEKLNNNENLEKMMFFKDYYLKNLQNK